MHAVGSMRANLVAINQRILRMPGQRMQQRIDVSGGRELTLSLTE